MLIMRRQAGGIKDPELIEPTYRPRHAGSGDLDAIALALCAVALYHTSAASRTGGPEFLDVTACQCHFDVTTTPTWLTVTVAFGMIQQLGVGSHTQALGKNSQ